LTVFTISGSILPGCCLLGSWMSWNWSVWFVGRTSHTVQFQLIQDTSRQQPGWTLPDTVNTVKCSWWWTKISPEACRAALK
jgi:hypothetical protein